ncbi:MAG: uroporphyrinogen decarboxylase family protein [Kosmotogaceae bacterium]
MRGIFGTRVEPDFEVFRSVIRGEKRPERVHLIELGVDIEVMKEITVSHLGREWREDSGALVRLEVDFYYSLGYETLVYSSRFLNVPEFDEHSAKDTAVLSRGRENWAEEGTGIIRTGEDLERIDWQAIKVERASFDSYKADLKPVMKLLLFTTLLESVLERWMGYEGLFNNLIEDPALEEDMFNALGKKVIEFYSAFIEDDSVGEIMDADDLGFKISTMISPKMLKKYDFSWLKEIGELAHDCGKLFIFHSCGNLASVMDDLMDYVKIDALHSFQDEIMQITQFKRKYPSIDALGGTDIDKLVRLQTEDVREYVRSYSSAAQEMEDSLSARAIPWLTIFQLRTI